MRVKTRVEFLHMFCPTMHPNPCPITQPFKHLHNNFHLCTVFVFFALCSFSAHSKFEFAAKCKPNKYFPLTSGVTDLAIESVLVAPSGARRQRCEHRKKYMYTHIHTHIHTCMHPNPSYYTTIQASPQ